MTSERSHMHLVVALPRALPLALALALSAGSAVAQGTAAAPAANAKPAAKTAKPAPIPATPREEVKSEALGLALAIETTEAINERQLAIASRVLTGKAQCEESQSVDVDAVAGKPGMFQVRFKNATYIMVPEETTTGAVRLLDRKSSVVWLQIPVKSMLLDNRVGRRMVDLCTHAEQRAAVDASKAAGANTPAKP